MPTTRECYTGVRHASPHVASLSCCYRPTFLFQPSRNGIRIGLLGLRGFAVPLPKPLPARVGVAAVVFAVGASWRRRLNRGRKLQQCLADKSVSACARCPNALVAWTCLQLLRVDVPANLGSSGNSRSMPEGPLVADMPQMFSHMGS